MARIVDFGAYKRRRARLGWGGQPIDRRARPQDHRDGRYGGLVSIGIVSEEVIRRLKERD